MIDEPHRVEDVGLRNVILNQEGQLRHQRKIALDFARNAGPADLHRQRAAIVADGLVNLRERCRRDRLRVKNGDNSLAGLPSSRSIISRACS